MLRHSAHKYFPPNSGRIAYWEWRNSTPHFARHQSKEMKILNISFLRVGIELTTLVPLRDDWPLFNRFFIASQLVLNRRIMKNRRYSIVFILTVKKHNKKGCKLLRFYMIFCIYLYIYIYIDSQSRSWQPWWCLAVSAIRSEACIIFISSHWALVTRQYAAFSSAS